MIPRPMSPALLPYTTLFRSCDRKALFRQGCASRPQRLAGLHHAGGHRFLGGLAPGPGVVHLLVADLAVDLEHAVVVLEQDRKSTRLNSSHSQISYAVFCLKK